MEALTEFGPFALGPQLPDRSAGFLTLPDTSLSLFGLNPGRAGPLLSVRAQKRLADVHKLHHGRVVDTVKSHQVSVRAQAGQTASGKSRNGEQHMSPDFACAALPAPAPKAGLEVCPDLSH